MRITFGTSILMLVIYVALLLTPRPFQHTAFISQADENNFNAEQYWQLSSAPGTVIVGSSMTARFRQIAEDKCAYNLALDGESAVTGLELIIESQKYPKVILVESNILDRTINQSMVDHAHFTSGLFGIFAKTGNKPINLAIDYLKGINSTAPSGRIGKPDQAARLASAVKSRASTMSHPVGNTLIMRTVETLKRQIATLEAKGVKIVFFELPINPALEQLAAAKQVKSIYQRNFSDHQYIDAATMRQDHEIKTTDGVHLTEEEVLLLTPPLKALFAPCS